METIICCLIFACGLITGVVIGTVMTCKSSIGKLRIDKSDREDGPFMFLELSKSIDKIKNKSYIIFESQIRKLHPAKITLPFMESFKSKGEM